MSTKKEVRGRRSEVRLTIRQAELLLECAAAYHTKWGLTPMERLLVGAVRRKVDAAKQSKVPRSKFQVRRSTCTR